MHIATNRKSMATNDSVRVDADIPAKFDLGKIHDDGSSMHENISLRGILNSEL